jgi:hypothetical protein
MSSAEKISAIRKFIPRLSLLPGLAALLACRSTTSPPAQHTPKSSGRMERIVVAPDSRGFVFVESGLVEAVHTLETGAVFDPKPPGK